MTSLLQFVETSPTILVATVLALIALSATSLFLTEIQRFLLFQISLASNADDEAASRGIKRLKEALDQIDERFGSPSKNNE